ncbi:MAG: methyl-accepting chemotaxis protein [Verrucomicrobiales bacterium]
MKSDLTIRKRIILSFLLVLLCFAMAALISWIKLRGVQRSTEHFTHDSMPGLEAISQAQLVSSENFSLVLEHVLMTDLQKKLALDQTIQENARLANRFLKSYEDTHKTSSDVERQIYQQFKDARQDYLKIREEILKLSDAGNVTEAQEMTREKLDLAYQQVRLYGNRLIKENSRTADLAAQGISDDVAQTSRTVAILVLIAILAGMLFGSWLLKAIDSPLRKLIDVTHSMSHGDFTQSAILDRQDEFAVLGNSFTQMTMNLSSLVTQVRQSSIQVNSTVTEIAASDKEQEATANEVAATTTEIGATAKEISATSRELVKTMEQVNVVAEDTAKRAATGQSGLTRMEDTMKHMVHASGSITAKLAVLSEKASNINQVVTTINKIADQTNLLSLNAAIEAEKAGEYGRGFSVVATEIRRLADQTAVATYDIEQMVKEMQTAVSAGVMGMDKFSEEMRKGVSEVQVISGELGGIIHQVQALTPRIETVTEGVQAQATGAHQISEALSQLTEAAQQTAESLRQSSMAIAQLNETASSLRNGITKFKLRSASIE